MVVSQLQVPAAAAQPGMFLNFANAIPAPIPPLTCSHWRRFISPSGFDPVVRAQLSSSHPYRVNDTRHRSSFHVRKLRGDLPIAHGENVDSAQVPRLSIPHLAVHPEHGRTIPADDHFLSIEVRVCVALKPRSPEFGHRGFALDATP